MHRVRLAILAAVAATPMARAQSPATSSLQRWPVEQQPRQIDFETTLMQTPWGESLRRFHDLLGSEPHIAGTEGDARNIERLATTFKSMGLEVEIHEFWAYLSSPIEAAVEIVSPTAMTLPIKEQPLDEDPAANDPAMTIGFNAYSGSGDVTAEVVYANYGTKSDFEKLKALGVDCTGKIVLARYGGNFRGYKAKFAEEAGAAGLIIYIDPDDSGYRKGVPYPEGGWANETCIQRGSLLTLDYVGDPLTPGEPATEHAARLDPEQVALPRIPVQPVGYGAAGEIMGRMRGRALPNELIKSWQGGLPFAYRLEGGAELRVRLMVKQERKITKTANVLGTLRGTAHPEQKVIIGCHHDAWCDGASDPLSGTILVMESARSFAAARDLGFVPARSIVFATWGAEEYGIVGSTEYCEQNAAELTKNAVAYINLDAAAMGPNFGSAASPSLKKIIEEVTRDVPQARATGEQTVHQVWLGDHETASFGDLGGGSDHVAFYCHLGIPSCGLGGEGSHGTAYHSNYDTVNWYRKVVGEDYQPALMLTRVVNLMAVRLADAPVLPLDPMRYAADMEKHLEALQKRAADLGMTVDFSGLLRRVDLFEKNAGPICEKLDERIRRGTLSDSAREAINQLLLTMEREWLEREGDGRANAALHRPWFRNLFAASDPDSGYAAWMLPELRLVIEQNDEQGVLRAKAAYGSVFDRLAERLNGIEDVLRAATQESRE